MGLHEELDRLEFRHFQLTIKYNRALAMIDDDRELDICEILGELNEVTKRLDTLCHVAGKHIQSVDIRHNDN